MQAVIAVACPVTMQRLTKGAAIAVQSRLAPPAAKKIYAEV